MSRFKQILLYSAVMGLLVFVLKWLQWKYLIADNSLEIYIGIIALLFTGLGVWVSGQLARPATVSIDQHQLEKLNLTSREYEVLQLITKGCSNAEIADKLFLSLSTVKTHVSNLFVKMDVKSRTQAVEKANRLKIID
ncbi:MAG: response regulator transcription factor [Bacteroidota bacterium]